MSDEPMSTPAYRAEMRKTFAIRAAKDKAWSTIREAYKVLEREEQAARDAYDADIRKIMGEWCDRWEDQRRVA